MAKASRDPWLVQRRVINGDVIVVQPRASRLEPKAVPPESAPAAAAEVGKAETGDPGWPSFTPAPPGHAYEFGTWRLIRLDDD